MSFTQLDRVSIDRVPIRRALISVYDKTGLEELARGLHEAGVKIVSTGSTAKKIAAAGIPVQEVEEVTGSPEMLDGRVKTLHPRVHGGILADRRVPAHMETLATMDIEPFDLVVVNLYPFVETVKSGAAQDDVVEQIDIGGPAMVRSAAKNHAAVAIVVDPSSYGDVVAAAASGGFDLKTRRRLAAKAFAHTATYDTAVASWTASQFLDEDGDGVIDWPAYAGLALERSEVLRYGENPHQQAALYVDKAAPAGIAQADQLHGKAMSYNNFVDADAALRAAFDFAGPAVAIIKHANPCGVAVGSASAADPIADAHAKAHACDPVSAFGGVIAANRTVTAGMARTVAGIFTEVVIAPGFEDEAVEILSKKKNIRLLALPEGYGRYPSEIRQVSGGVLVQMSDRVDAEGDNPANWTLAAGEAADAATLADLAFAWTACRAAKSNAILLAATVPPWASAWARSTGSIPASSPSSAPTRWASAVESDSRRAPAALPSNSRRERSTRACPRRRGGVGRVLPVRRRTADPDRRRRPRRRPARRLGPGRGSHRRGQRRGHHDVLHRRPALLPLRAARPGACGSRARRARCPDSAGMDMPSLYRRACPFFVARVGTWGLCPGPGVAEGMSRGRGAPGWARGVEPGDMLMFGPGLGIWDYVQSWVCELGMSQAAGACPVLMPEGMSSATPWPGLAPGHTATRGHLVPSPLLEMGLE